MNTKTLIYFVYSIVCICGCELGTDRVYMEMYTAMNANSDAIESSIDERIKEMEEAVKRKPDYRVLVPTAKEIKQITDSFTGFIHDVDSKFDERNFKVINDDEIKGKIVAHRHRVIDAIKKLYGNRSIRVTEKEIQEIIDLHCFPKGDLPLINGKPFDNYSFENQSIACNKAVLAKQKNDALMLARVMINYLSGKIGATALIFDKAVVISAPKAPFIIKGQTFETEIFLSFPSGSRQFPLTIKANDVELLVRNGIATFTSTPTTYGEHLYDVKITLTNPHNGRQETYSRTFAFEVGERCYE